MVGLHSKHQCKENARDVESEAACVQERIKCERGEYVRECACVCKCTAAGQVITTPDPSNIKKMLSNSISFKTF